MENCLSIFHKNPPEPQEADAVSMPECKLAFHPADVKRNDEDTSAKSAHLLALVSATSLQIEETAKRFHHVDRDGSQGHAPGFICIDKMVGARIREITALEAELETSNDGDQLPLQVRQVLAQAHRLDSPINEVKVEVLKAVLGEPELPEARTDTCFDPNGLYHRPGLPGADQPILD